MRIDVWSDLVCPWCYIGKRRLEAALAGFEHRARVEVVHHAYLLHGDMPPGTTIDRREMLRAKYHMSHEQVVTMDERMERLAAEDGLDYDLSGGVTGNTLDAHQLVQFAATLGRQDVVVERLFKAHFTERRSLFERASLLALVAEAGIDADAAGRVLDESTYADAVRHDHQTAVRLGAGGVPFFVFGNAYGLQGAQAVEVFAETLAKTWTASGPVTA